MSNISVLYFLNENQCASVEIVLTKRIPKKEKNFISLYWSIMQFFSHNIAYDTLEIREGGDLLGFCLLPLS